MILPTWQHQHLLEVAPLVSGALPLQAPLPPHHLVLFHLPCWVLLMWVTSKWGRIPGPVWDYCSYLFNLIQSRLHTMFRRQWLTTMLLQPGAGPPLACLTSSLDLWEAWKRVQKQNLILFLPNLLLAQSAHHFLAAHRDSSWVPLFFSQYKPSTDRRAMPPRTCSCHPRSPAKLIPRPNYCMGP